MVIDLIVSYTGVLAGIILSIISPEELKPGRKYFRLAQWGMYGLLVLGGALLLFREGRLAIALSVVGVGVLLGVWMECTECSTGSKPMEHSGTPKEPRFLFEKRFRPYHYFLPYLLFTSVYFLLSAETSHLLMASGIFLYGFPTGTLARLHWLESQEKQTKS